MRRGGGDTAGHERRHPARARNTARTDGQRVVIDRDRAGVARAGNAEVKASLNLIGRRPGGIVDRHARHLRSVQGCGVDVQGAVANKCHRRGCAGEAALNCQSGSGINANGGSARLGDGGGHRIRGAGDGAKGAGILDAGSIEADRATGLGQGRIIQLQGRTGGDGHGGSLGIKVVVVGDAQGTDGNGPCARQALVVHTAGEGERTVVSLGERVGDSTVAKGAIERQNVAARHINPRSGDVQVNTLGAGKAEGARGTEPVHRRGVEADHVAGIAQRVVRGHLQDTGAHINDRVAAAESVWRAATLSTTLPEPVWPLVITPERVSPCTTLEALAVPTVKVGKPPVVASARLVAMFRP